MLGRKKDPEQDRRSPEERARAAAERAARRAGRTGENPVVPPLTAFGQGDAPRSPAPGPAEPPGPVESPGPVEPTGREEPRIPEPPPAPQPPPRPEPPLMPEPSPTPPPPRRRPIPGPRSARPALPPRTTVAPSRGGPGPVRTPGRSTGARVLAVVALLVVAGALWLVNAIFQPLHGEGRGAVAVTIEPGWDVSRIGDELAQRGVVDNGAFFNLNATLTGNRGELKPGDYRLARGMSYGDAIDALVQGPAAKVVATFSLTIPEGRSRREVVPLLEDSDLEGDYLEATKAPRAVRTARRLGLPRSSDNLEGFLFPATYELVNGSNVADLVKKQLEAFRDNFARVDVRAAKRRNLTRYDVVIIASMVEREAQLDRERPLIAAVIHNRLRDGMQLGIDATIRYAEGNWTEPLKMSELERPGPYNTRLNRGLPPTPIGNPGLKSLQAAAKPANVDYLYYVVKPGTCGEHAFSSTDSEFQADRARYDAERERAGGKSPTTC